MVIGGEAGVGKSRLAAEAARRAHDHGILVLWGAAYEQEGQLPYGAIVEALDGVVVSQAPAARERLLRRFPDLSGLLPSLRGAGMAGGAPHDFAETGANRMRLFAAMVALLDELRGGQPLMLVLDDLHAADASILQVFYHLARMAGERPWFLVGTYRAGAVAEGSELKRLLTAAVRERVASRVELDRLNRDETDRLVASLLPGGVTPPELLEAFFARSLGNPLFVRELVQTMRSEGALTLADGRWTIAADATAAVPRQVRDVIDARVDRLGTDARRALTLVATAGAACSFQLLRDTGELTESSLLDALDRALAANLLDEQGDGYAFHHPLVRATLYDGLSRASRARLHAALAAAIERQIDQAPTGQPAPIEALAHHWAVAGESARAIPYLVQAADRAAAVYANAEAIDRLCQALSLLDEFDRPLDTSPCDRCAILERLGDLHDLVGEAGAARATYAAAIAAGGLNPLDSARLRRKCARQALFVGALAASDVLLDEAEAGLIEAVETQDALAERARILIARAQCDFLAFRFSAALAAGEEGLRLAEEAASAPDVARACEMVAMACLPLGQWQRGLEFEQRSGALTDLNGVVRETADVHLCLSEYHLYGDRPAETARAFLRALGEAERIGATRSLALCHYYLGNMAYFRGRFPEGVARLDEAIQLYRQVGSASGEAIALMMRGVTLTALGRLDEARQGMETGLEAAAHGTLRSHALIRLYAGLGRNRLDANDAIGAREYAERAMDLAEEPSDCICYAAFLPVATAAFALTGDLERASALGDRALAQARAINTPPLLCMAQQATAMAHAMTGRWDTAFAALDDARRLAEEHGFPYELGRTLLMRSFVHMQRRSGRDLAAASALTAEAWPILLRLGVRASAAQARSSLGFMRGQYGRQATRRKAAELAVPRDRGIGKRGGKATR
ncbi:MAG: ATP-binding protein [Thermomicrobiales bacterium]